MFLILYRHLSFFFLATFFLLDTLAFAEFTATPDALFAKESTHVIFRFIPTPESVSSPPQSPHYSLIELAQDGSVARYIGMLTDEKALGDEVAGDGVFTRKVQLNEKVSGQIEFAIIDESSPLNPQTITANELSSLILEKTIVKVIRHPSFLELLEQVWAKLKAYF